MAFFFELEFGPVSGPGEFTTRVVNAPSGGTQPAAVQLDVEKLLRDRDALETTVLASAVTARRLLTGPEQELRQVGRSLFDAMFSGPVLGAYRASVATAQQRGEPLRVVLRLTDPQLAALPWEALFDPETGRDICRTWPVVRQIPAPFTPEPLKVTPPLRVLGLVASPRGLPPLDVFAEQANLSKALAAPIAEGLIELEWLQQATWGAMHEKLLSDHWNVLHFIGHGDYDGTSDQGLIALVGESGRADLVEAEQLADLLNEARPTPRLVVLNSCSSGEHGTRDLFSSTAAALVHSGISAVAAMQFTVSDSAAIAFSKGFYTAIAHGRSNDDATSSGRIEILGTGRGTLEWVTPVLHVRGNLTHLFDLTERPPRTAQNALYAEGIVRPGAKDEHSGGPSLSPIDAVDTAAADTRSHDGSRVRTMTSAVKEVVGDLFRSKVGPRRRRRRRKAVAIAIAVALATVAAIVGLAIHNRGNTQLYRGYVLAPLPGLTGIDVRAEPKLSSAFVGNLPVNTAVYIVCVAIGEWVDGPGPQGQPRVSTPIWDKVRTEANGQDLGFVPDAWVNTGGTQSRAPSCKELDA
jgi:hypothetical protein